MTQLDDLLVDPPIVDTLRVDRPSSAFVVTFVPSDGLSDEPKLTVTVPANSVEGRQIQKWLDEFCRLLSVDAPVDQVVHGGGADFTLAFADDTSRQLSDPRLDRSLTERIYDGLQYIAQAAENAYRIVQMNFSRSA